MQPATKESSEKYYKYILCYVDDILCCLEKPKLILDYLGGVDKLKPGSVKELGRTAVVEVKCKLSEIGQKLTTQVLMPMRSSIVQSWIRHQN
jgi:hypothetical protein